MKKYFIILIISIFLIPCFAFSDIVTFKVGYFIPRAQSDLWEIEFENMDFTKTNFQSSNFSFSYEYFFSNEMSLILSIDTYTKQKTGVYIDYVGETIDGEDYAFDYGEGFPISHVFSVSSTPLQVGVKLTPLGRRGKFIPYIGGGAGLYIWSIKIQGESIHFDEWDWFYDPNIDEDVKGYYIYFEDAREENKLNIGFQVFGGIMFPVANRISIDAEFKYHIAKGPLTEGFEGFENFDLAGYQISVGLNYWF